ncbi:MAG: Transcriptional regulator, ArsR family [Candidatus Magasanikbacteria bacterium GW2011_GWA2_50_22]|uniref:Transcriptional regulator, ArsR family n=2 Tax=Parcubacteria group TaxID=1794811 RepID=A0A0G1ZE34_9BACT|nr:MAG: Transcriptional regulator, ArsR family [Candidatus Magasanikbacteria bacterium GW2011_GWA2_50_22]
MVYNHPMTDNPNHIHTGNFRRLERVVKGFANHRRLEILHLLHKEPELSVEDISERLNIGYENASDHLRKMAIAGLILKRNEGNNVRHKLTPRAESILVFCKILE